MFDLRSFSLDDMYRCSAEVRGLGEGARDGDDAANRIVSYLFEQACFPETHAPECPLVRLFRTQRLASLTPDDAAEVARALGADADPNALCLSLRATRGVEPQWNEVAASKRHRVLPLAPASGRVATPMVAALVSQLGIAPHVLSESPTTRDPFQLFDAFHVEHARGSRLLPDQVDFIEPYGIESVVGFGGMLPPDELVIVIVFSKVTLSKTVATLIRVLAPSIGLALLTATHDSTSFDARARAYEAIVRHHQELALGQHRELERLAKERERLLALAEEARADAQEASRAKDEFLAALGHELRNPLSPILTAVELMKLRSGRSREQEIVERQAIHLARLVDDLLDVARIARGKIELEQRPVEISAVVTRAVEIAGPRLDQRSQRLQLFVPREGLLVNGDLGRLSQVVSNLLDNASKYSPVGTDVILSAERVGEDVRIRVRDQGAGLPPEMLETIFTAFVQHRSGGASGAGSSTATAAGGGLGLGLTIVRKLVELHGGRVSAHSEGVGRGSVFVVELPLLTEAASFPAAPASELHVRPPRMTDSPTRVLVVDDNVDAANTLAEALTELGHEVLVAKDGPSALAVAQRFRPEVALLDIGLPLMDGYELAYRLRSLPDMPADLRLVAVTGYGQEGDRRRSIEAGFAAHLVKPIALSSLMEAVRA